MKINQIDNVNFGTAPKIGDTSIFKGLPKYSSKLAGGILDAFDKLAANGVNDEFVINIGHKRGAEKNTTDVVEMILFKATSTDGKKDFSSLSVSPKTLQKLSAEKITQKILDFYSDLSKSNKKDNSRDYYPIGDYYYAAKPNGSKPIKNEHFSVLQRLLKKYSYEDFTCI